MERVTGIGGIFFKVDDPEKLKAWNRDRAVGTGGGMVKGEPLTRFWTDLEAYRRPRISLYRWMLNYIPDEGFSMVWFGSGYRCSSCYRDISPWICLELSFNEMSPL